MVEPELFASLRPQTYGGAMRGGLAGGGGFGGAPGYPGGPGGGPAATGAPAPAAPKPESATRGLRKEDGAADKAFNVNGNQLATGGRERFAGIWQQQQQDLRLGEGVASAASATEMGDFFQYFIENPVTLARQKSAMLPIVNQHVEGTKVSIYNQGVHAKFPLLGLKFKNTTDLHLMQGPITVFEGSSYAGDARIQDLQPKEERLLSYAIDLGVEVEPTIKHDPQRLTSVKAFKGILHATNRLRESKIFNIKNRTEHERMMIIEHPYRQEYKLVLPDKPAERSRDVYRFELKVPAGKTATQEIVEERDFLQQIAINNMDDQSMRIFLNSNVTSEKVREALAKAVELKSRLAQTQRDVAELNRQYQEISQDQTRLRANLKELPPTAAAYKRYLEKFDQQETEIEKLQDQLKKQRQAEGQQRKEFEAYLLSLNVE
jgi:hypothetical protein